MTNTNVFKSFQGGTCSKASMKRLREILNERDDQTVSEFVEEKFARLSSAFNPEALSNSADDDGYGGEEPGMSIDTTVGEADNVIANTGINPLMFEEGIDTEARQNVLRLHAQAQKLKDIKEVSEEEMEKRDKVESDKKTSPHYRLMEVKREKNGSVRRFYWNGTEGYETWDSNDGFEDQEEWKNAEDNRKKRNAKVAVQLLYKKLGESKRGMKQAFNEKKYKLADEFKKEYEYCSSKLDALKALDEKKKQLAVKKRKDDLYTKWIQINNEGSKLTINDVKRMIDEKSLRYAEVVVEKERKKLFR